MSKARQEATLKKIERGISKLLPQPELGRIVVAGYEDEIGEDIQDLEDSGGEVEDHVQRERAFFCFGLLVCHLSRFRFCGDRISRQITRCM